MLKINKSVILHLSLLLNLITLFHFIPILAGSGQYKISPDKQFIAMATTMKDYNLIRNIKAEPWGELIIASNHDRNVPQIKLVVHPSGIPKESAYSSLNSIVEWSKDSESVTFKLPHTAILVDLKRSVQNTIVDSQ